jgi:hypothetical protein
MQRLIVVLATVLAWSMAASPAQPSAATLASPSPALYGVTINEVGHLEEIVGSLAAFAQRVQSYVSVLAPNVDIWRSATRSTATGQVPTRRSRPS